MPDTESREIPPPPPPPIRPPFARRSRGIVLATLALASLVTVAIFTLPRQGSPALDAPPLLANTTLPAGPAATVGAATPRDSAPPTPAASAPTVVPPPAPTAPAVSPKGKPTAVPDAPPKVTAPPSRKREAPPAVTKAPPVNARIVVNGVSADARIRVDGREFTTRTFTVPAGRHQLALVIAGKVRRTDSIRVKEGETFTWSPMAAAPPPKNLAAATAPPATPKATTPAKSSGPTCRSMMEAQQWDDAVTICTKEAEAGKPSAQRDLGELFERGRGVSRSEADAAKWYTKAADAGDRDAMFRIAVAYERGRGVKKDGPNALVWYTRAATAGLADAQFTVGQAWEKGKLGATKDKTAALEWYRKAAIQGHADAAKKVKDLSK